MEPFWIATAICVILVSYGCYGLDKVCDVLNILNDKFGVSIKKTDYHTYIKDSKPRK
jgi:adenine-specific DNA methylase